MANNELNACKFCGSDNLIETSNGLENLSVECLGCGASGPLEQTRAKMIAAWNRRAAPAQGGLSDALPKWIDDQKGKDPGIDDLIHYIERIRGQQGGVSE